MSSNPNSSENRDVLLPDTPSALELAVDQLDLGSRFSRTFALQFLEKARRGGAALPRVFALLDELAAAASDAGAGAGAGGRVRTRSALTPPSPYQRGCPEVVPGLTARAFWPREALPLPLLAFVEALEAAAPAIRAELRALRGRRAFQQYRAPAYDAAAAAAEKAAAALDTSVGAGADGSAEAEDAPRSAAEAADATAKADAETSVAAAASAAAAAAWPPEPLGGLGTDRGDWSVLYLDLHNAADAAGVRASRALCPATCAALERAPRAYGHALFSALRPGTHIPTHTGASNKKLRVHLPLVVPGDGCGAVEDVDDAAGGTSSRRARCRLRVGPHTRAWREGRCLVFDDSHQHEAWHDAAPHDNCDGEGEARVVLIVDVWHPDLSDDEVRFLSFARAAQMRRAKALSAARAMPPALDFYAVLADARRRGADDGLVFGGDSAAAVARAAGGKGAAGEGDAEVAAAAAGPDEPPPPPLPHGAVEVRDD
jgi:hypothetical protein